MENEVTGKTEKMNMTINLHHFFLWILSRPSRYCYQYHYIYYILSLQQIDLSIHIKEMFLRGTNSNNSLLKTKAP